MRPLRVKVSTSAFYHVMSRAIERRFIFDDLAAAKFLLFMRQVEEFTGVKVVTYCVMSNHVHLLLQVPQRKALTDAEMLERLQKTFSTMAFSRFKQKWDRMIEQGSASGLDDLRQGVLQRMYDLSFFMKELKQRFSTWHNFREKRKGPVWEDRFKSSLIQNAPGYLATAAAYIDNNPVRAGLVEDPKDHRFCGYAAALAGDKEAIAGLAILTGLFSVTGPAYKVLSRYRLLLFGKGILKEGRAGYSPEEMNEVFEKNGELRPWELAKHRLRWMTDGAVIGSKAFVSEMRTSLREKLGYKRTTGAYEAENASEICSLRAMRFPA